MKVEGVTLTHPEQITFKKPSLNNQKQSLLDEFIIVHMHSFFIILY